jgi:PKD repeat protein
MPTLNARATVVAGTSNTTWSTTANSVDGAFGAANNTYSVWTNTTANAVGYIELGFGTQFASIPANAVITNISVTMRSLVSNTARIAALTMQPFDGTTAIGSPFTCTRNTANTANTSTWTPTLAQLQSANFKIRTTATRFNGTQAGTFSIDNVDVVVTYVVPPVASFTANKVTVEVGKTVQFTDTSTNTPTGWSWNFGGGAAASTQQNPLVTFNTVGSYSVVLTATNSAGSDPSDATIIEVTPPTTAVVWNGSAWVGAESWNGSAWVTPEVWNGTEWKQMEAP